MYMWRKFRGIRFYKCLVISGNWMPSPESRSMQLKRSSHCSVCTKAAHLIAQQALLIIWIYYRPCLQARGRDRNSRPQVDQQVTFLRHDLVHGSC